MIKKASSSFVHAFSITSLQTLISSFLIFRLSGIYSPVRYSPASSTFSRSVRLPWQKSSSPRPSIMASSQREAYQLPSQSDSQSRTTNQQTTSYTTSYGIQAGESSAGPQVQYICGECNHKVSLGRGDAIRCKECGHRVLYKERTKR